MQEIDREYYQGLVAELREALDASIHVCNILRSPHSYHADAEAEAEKTLDDRLRALLPRLNASPLPHS